MPSIRVPPSGERRWATILFADLAGYTAFCEGRDPEEVLAVTDRCMSTLADIVERLGGFVTRVIGDELMAVFGAPVAHDDDTERAVRTGLEMQRRASRFPEDFGGLKLRIGINTGEILFAPVGPGQARQPMAMGDAVNVAARLQQAALEGGVLVGEETYRGARRSISYEQQGPLQVKGKQHALSVWVATEAIDEAESISSAPMLGREAELAKAAEVWDMVVADRVPRLLTIWGPAGIGKSRLCRELIRRVEHGPGRVLSGRSIDYGESLPYGAFGQQLRALAGVYLTDAPGVARRKLARTLALLLPASERNQVTPAVSVLAGLAPGAPTGDRNALFFAARRVVEAAAEAAPTLFIFEDLQLASESLLDLLSVLAERVAGQPALFVCLARPELLERCPGWSGRPGELQLSLDPLPRAAATEFGRRLSGGAEIADAALQRLLDRAEGNPLFIQELIRSLVEGTPTLRDVPPTVWAVIAARLDALPEPERRLMFEASVLGRVFWKGVLEAVVSDPATVGVALARLEARGLLRRAPSSRIEGDEEFVFGNALFCDVAYRTLSSTDRRERHAAIAGYLEARPREQLDAMAAVAGHHWREAGEAERAITWLTVAAERAGKAWAKAEAMSLYQQVLELLPDRDRRRLGFRLRMALLLVESADYRPAIPLLEDLIPELEGHDLVTALMARSHASFWTMDTDRAQVLAQRAVDIAVELGADELRLGAASWLAVSLSTLPGRTGSGIREGESALAAWPRQSSPAVLANHLASLGTYYGWIGDYRKGELRSRAGQELAEETHQVEAMLVASSHLGVNLTGLGRHQEALEVLERAAAQGRELELVPRFTSRVLNMAAGTLRELYAFDEARLRNEEAIEMSQQAGFPFSRGQALVDLHFLDLIEGKLGSAENAWPGLMVLAEGMRGWHQWLMIGRLITAKAELELRMRRPSEAALAAAQAIAHARAVGRRKYEVMGRAVLGSAMAALGRPEDALRELRRARAGAGRLRHPPSIWDADLRLARVLAAVGDEADAAAALQSARTSIDRFATDLSPRRRAAFLSIVQAQNPELGRLNLD